MPLQTSQRRGGAKRPLDHDPERVRARRVELGLTQAVAAELTGISAGHLSEIETGARNPSPDVLRRLADTLEIAPRELMARPA